MNNSLTAAPAAVSHAGFPTMPMSITQNNSTAMLDDTAAAMVDEMADDDQGLKEIEQEDVWVAPAQDESEDTESIDTLALGTDDEGQDEESEPMTDQLSSTLDEETL